MRRVQVTHEADDTARRDKAVSKWEMPESDIGFDSPACNESVPWRLGRMAEAGSALPWIKAALGWPGTLAPGRLGPNQARGARNERIGLVEHPLPFARKARLLSTHGHGSERRASRRRCLKSPGIRPIRTGSPSGRGAFAFSAIGRFSRSGGATSPA